MEGIINCASLLVEDLVKHGVIFLKHLLELVFAEPLGLDAACPLADVVAEDLLEAEAEYLGLFGAHVEHLELVNNAEGEDLLLLLLDLLS